MSKIVLVAETGSDLPVELAKEYGIRLVPMHVAFGSETRDDGTFDPAEIYSFFSSTGKLTQTSGCTVGDLEVAFREIREENPEAQIEVFDTLSTGPEMRLIVEKIIELDSMGLSFEEVCEKTREYIKKTRLFSNRFTSN